MRNDRSTIIVRMANHPQNIGQNKVAPVKRTGEEHHQYA